MSSSTLSVDLRAAVIAGDLETVKTLSTVYTPPPIPGIAQEAATSGQAPILEWCFSQGFQPRPESINDDFYHAACESESPDVFRVLVKHGYDLNAHSSEYYGNALCVAAWKGNVALAKCLLEIGQDPNTGVGLGDMEAITWAISGDNPSIEIVKLLLNHGLKLAGTGAAIAAAEADNIEALKLVLDHGANIEEEEIWWQITEPDSENSKGTALYRACRAGKVRAVTYLLERGASLNAKDQSGRSCLAIAKAYGHDEIVKLLEAKGVKE